MDPNNPKRHLPANFETNEASKKHVPDTKSLKKPTSTNLDNESKRKAQNRAAQRAFRERKEHRLQDLEDKVKELEDEKSIAHSENEFLRLQVERLKEMLDKLTKQSPQSPTSLSDLKPPSSKFGFDFQFNKNTFNTNRDNNQIKADSPLPTLIRHVTPKPSPSSVFTSPHVVSPPDHDHDVEMPQTSPANFGARSSIPETFDETVEEFCLKMSEACGTKDCPVPKRIINRNFEGSNIIPESPAMHSVASPFSTYTTSSVNSQSVKFESDLLSPPLFDNMDGTELDYIFQDDAIDSNFVFNWDEQNRNQQMQQQQSNINANIIDPNSLNATTKRNSYDALFGDNSLYPAPYSSQSFISPGSQLNNSNIIPHTKLQPDLLPTTSIPGPKQSFSLDIGLNNSEVVPAQRKLLPCSEIWERISSHSKYTELDIEGLCNELKAKAKCSDKGVVVEENVVDSILSSL